MWSGGAEVICTLLLAAGEGWESTALAILERAPQVAVLKRCVDVDDLMAAATSGQADVAVVALDAPGLDPSVVTHLRRHALRPVAVTNGPPEDLDVRERASRLGISTVVGAADMAELAELISRAEGVDDTRAGGTSEADHVVASADEAHRVITVWGPTGAPGRTTVAVNVAAELARRGAPVLLVDADPYGGSVAQQLGVLDEVSGLLSAARLAGSGQLAQRWGTVCRGIDEHLAVVTGLPRADRWREVRGPHVEQLLESGRARGHVVVDTGFSLEDDPGSEFGGRPARNAMTHAALDLADEVVVVGSADPVGLSRLARGLVDLRERSLAAPTRVVVNRMRPSIGWSEREIAGMVEGFARISGLHFLAEDRAALDRALVTGRALVDGGRSPVAEAIAGLVDAVFPGTVLSPPKRAPGRFLRSR